MDLLSVGMDSTSRDIERDCAFGGLFQQIINEMKNSSPLWEDLTMKSSKLHACLRSTIQAVSAFLEAFQKIADAATSTKGATKDIGTALTRICLRHKALEAKLKTFTSSIFDCLILPLQERLEEWKRVTMHLDKEHAKEYKRGRTELKKRSIETLRLHKKVRKMGAHNGGMSNSSFTGSRDSRHSRSGHTGPGGGESFQFQQQQSVEGGVRELHRMLEAAVKDTNEKRLEFEEMEKQAIRTALIEERSRFCLFVSFFKPVVDEEVEMLSELTHVQEAMQQLEKHSMEPFSLPASSEQVIADLKGSCDSGAWFQTPPSSPSSLGSRKSSLCSISSTHSSSSGSVHSPPHNFQLRNQHPPPHKAPQKADPSEDNSPGSSNSSTPSLTYAPGGAPGANSAWPNIQDSLQFERAACAIMNDRPHTISAAYERNQERPPLTAYTYQARDSASHPTSPHSSAPATPLTEAAHTQGAGPMYQSASEIYGALRGRSEMKPPVPKRASSLERVPSDFSQEATPPPPNPSKNRKPKPVKTQSLEPVQDKSIPALPDFNQSSPDMIVPQPVYVNMHELNQMAAARRLRHHELPPPPPELMGAEAAARRQQQQQQQQDQGVSEHQHQQALAAARVVSGREAVDAPRAAAGILEAGQQGDPQQSRPRPPARQASSLSTSPVTSRPSGPSLSSPTVGAAPLQQQSNAWSTGGPEQATASASAGAHSGNAAGLVSYPSWELESPPTGHQREVRSNSLDDALRHINVAETIKTLTERNHQPVSPNMSVVRRAHSLKQADEKSLALAQQRNTGHASSFPVLKERERANSPNQRPPASAPNQPASSVSAQHQHKTPGEQHQPPSYLNQIYQQIAGPQSPQPQPAAVSQSAGGTPRQARRFSEELLKSTASFVQNHVLGNSGRTPPPAVSSKEMFVQTLNARLSQMRASPPTERRQSSPTLRTSLASKLVASVTQHHGLRGGGDMSTAFRVRQWIASKTISDPSLCRESLMDQIRHYDGRRLRHIRAINDRSAPRIR